MRGISDRIPCHLRGGRLWMINGHIWSHLTTPRSSIYAIATVSTLGWWWFQGHPCKHIFHTWMIWVKMTNGYTYANITLVDSEKGREPWLFSDKDTPSPSMILSFWLHDTHENVWNLKTTNLGKHVIQSSPGIPFSGSTCLPSGSWPQPIKCLTPWPDGSWQTSHHTMVPGAQAGGEKHSGLRLSTALLVRGSTNSTHSRCKLQKIDLVWSHFVDALQEWTCSLKTCLHSYSSSQKIAKSDRRLQFHFACQQHVIPNMHVHIYIY